MIPQTRNTGFQLHSFSLLIILDVGIGLVSQKFWKPLITPVAPCAPYESSLKAAEHLTRQHSKPHPPLADLQDGAAAAPRFPIVEC